MRKIYCGKLWKFKKSKISYIFEKTFVLSIICNKCGNKNGKILKEESIKILKIVDLIKYISLLYNWRKHKPRI